MAELDSTERLSVFRGDVITADNDPVLQALTTEAAELAATPLAAVSLVMGSVQYFRAHHGLPPELETSRATSRADSFCQFVVKGESAFEVNEASQDKRVPQHLVNSYGIEAYLGVPVTVDGEVAGSLCVIDVEARSFAPELEAKLVVLAGRVSARLGELGRASDADAAAGVGEQSAKHLAENLVFQARLLERAMSEIGPLVRIGEALSHGKLSNEEAQRAASVLTEAAPVFELLIEESKQLRATSSRLSERLGGGESS